MNTYTPREESGRFRSWDSVVTTHYDSGYNSGYSGGYSGGYSNGYNQGYTEGSEMDGMKVAGLVALGAVLCSGVRYVVNRLRE